MEIQLNPIARGDLADEISKSLDQLNNTNYKNMKRKYATAINISYLWYLVFFFIIYISHLYLSLIIIHRRWLYVCMKSRKMVAFSIILYITLSITIGVLTVVLTSPKSSMFEFELNENNDPYNVLKLIL